MDDKKLLPSLFIDSALSVTGNHKPLNEDAFKASPNMGLWVVADGMGGYEGGEIASQLAVTHITRVINEGVSLMEGIQQAHDEICQLAKTQKGKKGMATTVVVAKIVENQFEIAWVGDSRAYLFEKGQLKQLTHDHSFIQTLIDSGHISEQQAKIHPQRNLISQALGGNTPLHIDTITGTIADGILLLCSDGLSSELSDSKIAAILAPVNSLSWKADKLVHSVLAREAHDNITVLLIQNRQVT
ncbi:MAG: protein phosphatase 2C domain-containing protein [Methylococcales bacterium]|nr:protein phosphatase 2C domain-containing protein [Methylococcales bacterium]